MKAYTMTKSNSSLHSGKTNKDDEFYTQLSDIAKEVHHYERHFKNQKVLLNCDDPLKSNFAYHFSQDFKHLKLASLTSSCYKESGKGAYLEYNAPGDVEYFKGDGDFRSNECIELLEEADTVVGNPPFSLFRPYVKQLVEYDKKYLIMGSINAITYKEIFPLLMANKMWLGYNNGGKEFMVPDHYDKSKSGHRTDENGQDWRKLGNVCWFTNMEIDKRSIDLPLYKRYSPSEYPKYDNYDAINVDKVTDIPEDYSGVMGVPITIFENFNPDQFEILGITKTWFGAATKTYKRHIKANRKGIRSFGTTGNAGPMLRVATPPVGKTYYIIEDEFYIQKYARILIRNKKPVTPTQE